eukprot:scaffold65198_cov39-Prasinocladus_malaysianus.AAC.1
MTKPACDLLLGRTEDAQYMNMRPLGYYAFKHADMPILLSQLEPPPWDLICPGIARDGAIKNLDKVAPPPVGLIAPPGSSSFRDAELAGGPGDSDTTDYSSLSVSLVVMSCGTLDGAPDRMTSKIKALVDSLAQTFCGYVVPTNSKTFQLPNIVFLNPNNAV